MAHSRNVSFIKPSEPSFLKAFKAKVGYKEPDNVDTKRQVKKEGPEKDRYIEDELPTVVMEGGEVTEEEYKTYMKAQLEESRNDNPEPRPETSLPAAGQCPSTDPSPNDGGSSARIVFKRPKKRTSSEADSKDKDDPNKGSTHGGLFSSSKKKPPSVADEKSNRQDDRRHSSRSSRRGVKNSSLLSFDDENET